MYGATIGARRYTFRDLANLLAKASPLRSGDQLAGRFDRGSVGCFAHACLDSRWFYGERYSRTAMAMRQIKHRRL